MPKKRPGRQPTLPATTKPRKKNPRLPGRPPGSTNKRNTLVRDLIQSLTVKIPDSNGKNVDIRQFDPVFEMVALYERAMQEFANDPSDFRAQYLAIAQKSLIDIMQYCHPKRKAVDSKGNDDVGQTLTDILKQIAENSKGK